MCIQHMPPSQVLISHSIHSAGAWLGGASTHRKHPTWKS